MGSVAADFATQVTTQYIENKSVDLSKEDLGRGVKTGTQTALGTAVSQFGNAAGNAVDAFGTALIWAEASTLITIADVIVTNAVAAFRSSSESASVGRYPPAFRAQEILFA